MRLTIEIVSGNIFYEGLSSPTITIYRGREIMTTAAIKSPVQVYVLEENRRFAALSQSQQRVAYEVIVHSQPPGDLSCNCKGYEFRRSCKYVSAVEAQLATVRDAEWRADLEAKISDLYHLKGAQQMEVTQVAANIRYSKDIGQGWKTIELGAEATVGPEEDWTICQTGLYALLTSQLRTVWGWNQNGHSPEPGQNGPEKPVETTWQDLESRSIPSCGKASAQGALVWGTQDRIQTL
jgi:hypothetical protein